jgi:tetratricopeptide (TPR) repeat protein
LKRACALPGAAKESHCNRGLALANLGRHAEALDAFNSATSRDPHYAKAWHLSAISLLKLARYDEAMAAHERAPDMEPDPSFWHLVYGRVLLDRGDASQAQCSFEAVLQRDPKNGNARAGLARSLLLQGDVVAAIALVSDDSRHIEVDLAFACAAMQAGAKEAAAFELDHVLDSVRGDMEGRQQLSPRERVEFLGRLLMDPALSSLWSLGDPPELSRHVRVSRQNAQSLLEVARSIQY